MKKITLQQDAAEKIKVTADENTIVHYLKSFFNWRKDITLERFSKLGTVDHDLFIKHLANKLKTL